MKRSFGEALLVARKQKGLSQQEFAGSLPVSRSSVANWEADRRLPNATIIAKIAEILDISSMEVRESLKKLTNDMIIEKGNSNSSDGGYRFRF